MDENQRKHNGQIEIADLISEAVSNATARRNQVLDSEEPLSLLSDAQAKGIVGGYGDFIGLDIEKVTLGFWEFK